jgi:hypothetical protein
MVRDFHTSQVQNSKPGTETGTRRKGSFGNTGIWMERHRGTRGSPQTGGKPSSPCLASRLLCGVEDVQPLLHMEDHEAGHLQLVWVAALTGRR